MTLAFVTIPKVDEKCKYIYIYYESILKKNPAAEDSILLGHIWRKQINNN